MKKRSAFKEVASVSCQWPVGTGKAYRRVGVKTETVLNFRTFVFFVSCCVRRLAFGGLLFFLTMVAVDTLQADPNNTETRLRELLRNTMLQLRAAETERASLQNAQAENEKQKKELSDQVEVLSKELKSDKETADQTIGDLRTRNSQLEADLAQIKEALGKWKESQKQAIDLAVAKEAQRAKLAADNILLQRRVDDYRAKNLALFKLGNEILDRYDKFGLGDALTAREPFTGLTRVKMQNLVQDYQDKLADQKIKP